MVKPQLIQEQPISLAEVKHELERVKARDGQLSFRGGKCEEDLHDFSTLSVSKAQELRKKIDELAISRVKPEQITMVVDLLPDNADDVKMIFQGSTVSLTRKDMERIAETVQQVK